MLSPKVQEITRMNNPYAYGADPNSYGTGQRDPFLAEYVPRNFSDELVTSMGAVAVSGQVENITAKYI